MRRHLILLLWAVSLTTVAWGQSQIHYGVRAQINGGLFTPNSQELRSNPGVGLAMFGGFGRNKTSSWRLTTELQFEHVGFFSAQKQAAINYSFGNLGLGIRHDLKNKVYFRAAGLLGARQFREIYLSRGNQGNFQSDLKRDIGYQLGVGIRTNDYSSLSLEYIRRPVLKLNSISIAYSLYFNDMRIGVTKNKAMSEALSKLRSDVLYVVNRACSDSMSDELLDSLFGANYDFSSYKIVSSEQVDSIKQHHKPVFFALIGKHYAGLGEPVTDGIFLMDKNFDLTEFPYPVYTAYYSSFVRGEACFQNPVNSARTIREFNARLRRHQ